MSACTKNYDHKKNKKNNDNTIITLSMKERQISFSPKKHALDNNDNFSPDNRFLCYDTRGTVYNENLANCKSIEKIEIETGVETILWHTSKYWVFAITNGYVAAINAEPGENFWKTVMLTYDEQQRGELVVSNDGNMLAYTIFKPSEVNGESKKFRQIFVLEPDWKKIGTILK